MKKYILDGLEIGIEAPNKEWACMVALTNNIGLMPENLIEVEKIPNNYRILT